MRLDRYLPIIAGLLAAPTAVAQETGSQSNLGWLSGYWLRCEYEQDTGMTWSGEVGAIMLGHTIAADDDSLWEQMRIDKNGGNPVLIVNPWGEGEVAFPMTETSERMITFERSAPAGVLNRIIYRREGDRLHERIEGTVEGKEEGIDLHYQMATLNSRCGASKP